MNQSLQIQLQLMNQEELTVEVVDRRLQVDLGQQESGNVSNPNQFMPQQGFESKQPEYEEQEEQQQEPHYTLEKLLPKQNQKERLIEQNIKLKTQIYELAKQLDEIIQKDKSKKKAYGIGLGRVDEEDQLVREKKLEVHKQQIELNELKHKIFLAKRQLQCVYNNENITLKQNEIKNLRFQLKTLEDERDGHLNIQKLQTKALKIARNQQEYNQKLRSVTEETAKLKKESKEFIDRIQVTQRQLLKLHDSHVVKCQNLRQIQQKLALNKEKEKTKSKKHSQAVITEEMIQNMENEVKKLEVERKQGEKLWQDKIKAVDVELILKRAEEEKKLIILRQKERQLKVNELRIRQLRKLVRSKEEGTQGRRTQEMDMSQFRHKRNIIKFEK